MWFLETPPLFSTWFYFELGSWTEAGTWRELYREQFGEFSIPHPCVGARWLEDALTTVTITPGDALSPAESRLQTSPL